MGSPAENRAADTEHRHRLEAAYANVIQGPQPESLKDFTVRAKLADGREKTLAEIKDNYQKRVVIDFPAEDIKRVTIKCLSTNGAPEASILEVRAYGNA